MRFLYLALFAIAFWFTPTIESYTRSQYVDADTWEIVKPYLLPEDHPIKSKLDEIFKSKKRVIASEDTLVAAGFSQPKPNHNPSRPYVLKHPKLEGYLLKMFTDEVSVDEAEKWMIRINGAQVIQQAIERYGYDQYFSVPKKWIYPLPQTSAGVSSRNFRKNFVLVVQNMEILPKEENRRSWKSAAITKDVLDALFHLITVEGLADSVFVFNIPFSKIDGKISFIDTEDYHIWPIDYDRLAKSLSKDMKKYWRGLVRNNLP